MAQELADFDEMLILAKENPEKLEEILVSEVNSLIAEAPEALQARLRGLQFQIDMQRRLAKTPMASCIKISNMMHASFDKLRNVLNGLDNIAHRTGGEEAVEAQEYARVIPFRVR